MGWRFRIFGIPVRIQPWFLLIAVFLGPRDASHGWLGRMLVWILIVFTGVLAHELGHAFTGRGFGLVPSIELHGMGGLTWWERGRALGPGRSIVVSLAGPFVGIAIGTVSFVVLSGHPFPRGSLAEYALLAAVWVNLGWGVLNLFPMLPLDGGNVVASVFEIFAKDNGRRFARYASLFLAVGLAAWALATPTLPFHLDKWFTAILLGFLAFQNWRGLRADQQLARTLPLRPHLEAAVRALQAGDGAAAAEAAEQVIAKATDPRVKDEGYRLLAWGRLVSGDAVSAQRALAQMTGEPEPALQGLILVERGNFEAAIGHLVRAVEHGGGPLVEEGLARAFRDSRSFEEAADFFESPGGANVGADTVFRIEHAAYEAGDYGSAARLGKVLFEREREPIRAFNVACSLARAGDLDASLAWLERAHRAGFDDAHLLDTDEDLATVRALPGFAALRARIG